MIDQQFLVHSYVHSDSFETIARSPMTDSEESWLGHVRSCRVSYKDLYISLAHMGVHGLGTTLRVHNSATHRIFA